MTPAAARSRRSEGRRRAVTLLELLVVLAVLGAILTMALPLALRSMNRNAFQSVQTAIVSALGEARAHAQRDGAMVEVTVDRGGRRLRAMERSLDDAPPRAIEWIEVLLEAPLTLAVGEPPDEGAGEPGAGERGAESEQGAGGEIVVLFLPDGSAPMARPCILRGLDDTEAVISIGRLLGRAMSVERRVRVPGAEEPAGPIEEQAPAAVTEASR